MSAKEFSDLVENMKQRLGVPSAMDLSLSNDNLIIREYSDVPRSAWAGAAPGIEVIHIPTGIRVNCTEHRSPFKNKSACFKLLQAELNTRFGGQDADQSI